MKKVVEFHRVIVSLMFLLVSHNLLCQNLVDIEMNHICKSEDVGSIDFYISQELADDYPLPYSIEVENLTTGDFFEFQINSLVSSLDEMQAGSYEILIILDEFCEYLLYDELFESDINFEFSIEHASNEYFCHNGSISLSVNGGYEPYQFSWTYNDGSGPSFFSTDQNLTNLRSYSYCVTITDANCGTVSKCFLIKCCASLPQMIVNSPTCSNSSTGSILVDWADAQGPDYFISWTGPNGFSSDSENIYDIEVGTYTATFINPYGCHFTRQYSIVDDNFSVNSAVVNPSCGGCNETNIPNGSIELIVSSNSQYEVKWFHSFNGSPTGSPIGIENSLNNLAPGEYIAVVKNTDCTYLTSEFRLECIQIDNSLLSYDLEDFGNPTCAQGWTGFIDLSVTSLGKHTVTWYHSQYGYPAGNPIGKGDDIYGLNSGEYVAVINNGICTITTEEFRIVCCYSGEGGGWSDGGSTSSTLVNPTITIKENWTSSANSCDGYAVFSTNLPSNVTLDIDFFKITNFFPPTYEEIYTLEGLCMGSYCIRVNTGCSVVEECFSINTCELMNVSANVEILPTCDNVDIGKVIVTPSGGVGPYRVEWIDLQEQTLELFENVSYVAIEYLQAGLYTIAITDKFGCKSEVYEIIIESLGDAVLTRDNCDITYTCGSQSETESLPSDYYLHPDFCYIMMRRCNDGFWVEEDNYSLERIINVENFEECIQLEICHTGQSKLHYGQLKFMDMTGVDNASDCNWCTAVTYCDFDDVNAFQGTEIENYVVEMELLPIEVLCVPSTVNDCPEEGYYYMMVGNCEPGNVDFQLPPICHTAEDCDDFSSLAGFNLCDQESFWDLQVDTTFEEIIFNGNTEYSMILTPVRFDSIALKKELTKRINLTSGKNALKFDDSGDPIQFSQQRISKKVNYFPNPTSEIVTFALKKYEQDRLFIDIYDTASNMLKTFIKTKGSTSVVIDMSDLNAGIYIFCIRDGNEVIFRDKIIKI